jgi:hypothetical protein
MSLGNPGWPPCVAGMLLGYQNAFVVPQSLWWLPARMLALLSTVAVDPAVCRFVSSGWVAFCGCLPALVPSVFLWTFMPPKGTWLMLPFYASLIPAIFLAWARRRRLERLSPVRALLGFCSGDVCGLLAQHRAWPKGCARRRSVPDVATLLYGPSAAERRANAASFLVLALMASMRRRRTIAPKSKRLQIR